MTEGVVLEKFSKNKKGRPRKYTKEYLNRMSRISPSIKTERGLIEFSYQCRSFGVIVGIYEKDLKNNKWVEYYIDTSHRYIFHSSIH